MTEVAMTWRITHLFVDSNIEIIDSHLKYYNLPLIPLTFYPRRDDDDFLVSEKATIRRRWADQLSR
jgi:hypothetical protein